MRSFIIIITVLSALAACYGAAVLPSEEYPEYSEIYKYNEDDGPQESITKKEEMRNENRVLLHEQRFVRTAIPNVIQNVDILYYGQPNTMIEAAVVSTTPPASWVFPVWHLNNYISIRISTQRGLGFNGTVEIYGTL